MERAALRVLIVTGHMEVGQGLRTVLGLADSTAVVEIASSLISAVEHARQLCPDVVLVDLEMPREAGYKTIQELKRLFPGIQTVALTAHDYPSARARAVEAGAKQVIVKGLEYQEFVSVIQAASVKEESGGSA